MCFAVTTFFSSMPIVSIKFSIVNVTYALVFFVWLKYLLFMKPGIFQRIMGLFSLSLIVVLVFSLIQFHRFDWDPVTIRGIFRPFYKDNTIFGATSALIASFWLAYALKTNSLVSKVLYLSLGMVFLAGVVLSTSRAAVLSLIFFIIILTILLLRVRLKYVVMGIIISLFIGNLFRNQIFEFLKKDKHMSHSTQFGYMEQLESSGNISTDVSNIERLNRWVAGWQMFAKKPITGFGPGTYQFAYIPYQKKEFMSRLTVKDPWHIPENSGGTAHSEYLLALSEMGLFGLIALLALLGRWTWIAFVKARNHPLRVNIIIGFAVLSTYFFHAFFNNFLSTDKFSFLFWGTAAWMASQMELKPNEQIRL
jgi:O-antigen ligase